MVGIGRNLRRRRSGPLVGSVVSDVYSTARNWSLRRFRRTKEDGTPNRRPQSFTIYGPDGRILKRWHVDGDGEHDDQ